MARTSLTMTVRVDGVHETLDAFRDLPKDANDQLRDRAQRLAQLLADRATQSGRAEGRQARLVATTVKARRDRVPVVEAGGTKRLGRNRAPAFKLLFGSEFGSRRYRQFRPHLGRGSYWFFKTIESEEALISREWNAAADEIIDEFTRGG
ncbi:hypothetical protein [Jiangella asiatica]|uniref:HK97 gp10 family phage protein n=1 Tax=Jiangella asiatica TaxID=2530372 RepID=A0A4R5CIG3_9ACTN|nr:hypothetical protein [Jiangella asiatica]TDD98896.1 hypothetical protein E1269_28235 [Jiangella asiatica]